MFKKKFNHDDINHYKPITDLKQLLTPDFLNNKYKNMMPEHITEIISINSLIEDEEEREIKRYEILKKKKEYDEKLLNEYLERCNENNNLEDGINNLSINNE